jgi:bifunctional enzyme CysN/CysC
VLVVASIISPYAAGRLEARGLHAASGLGFFEVYLDTPLEICEQRDRRGLYARARRGEVSLVTGIDDPYEPPEDPELVVHPAREPAGEVVAHVLDAVLATDLSGVLRRGAPATA